MSVTTDTASAAAVSAVRDEWLTIAQAASLVGVSERTIRRWVAAKIITSKTESAHGHPVRLVRRDTLPDTDEGHAGPAGDTDTGRASEAFVRDNGHRGPDQVNPPFLSPPTAGTDTGHADTSADRDTGSAAAVDLARLQARLDGAQTACRVHAARRAEQERIVAFLKGQLEQSREAEEQLRVLIGMQAQALKAALERPALSPAEEPIPIDNAPARPRPWWRWWGRG